MPAGPRARHRRRHARWLRGGHRRRAARVGRSARPARSPSLGARAFARIDWSTAFVVGGIVTYVGVLQKLDAVNLLGREAMAIGSPLLAALVICMIAALVSAFASTTGVLAALVPMAVPLASSGGSARLGAHHHARRLGHHRGRVTVLEHRCHADRLGARRGSATAAGHVAALEHGDGRGRADCHAAALLVLFGRWGSPATVRYRHMV